MTAPPSDTGRLKELLAKATSCWESGDNEVGSLEHAYWKNGVTRARIEIVEALPSLLTALDAAELRLAEAEAERDKARSTVQAWVNVAEGLEAHIMDRAAMADPAKPETYLSILRADVAGVARSSEQICASRWHDAKVAREQNEALSVRLAEADRVVAPFATFGANNVGEDGWTNGAHGCQRERVVDWFDPSDFRAALAFLNAAGGEK